MFAASVNESKETRRIWFEAQCSVERSDLARAQFGSGWVRAGAFTFAIRTRFLSEVSRHYLYKRVICLLYFLTEATVFQTTYDVQVTLSCAHPYSRAEPSAARFRVGVAGCKRIIPHSARTFLLV